MSRYSAKENLMGVVTKSQRHCSTACMKTEPLVFFIGRSERFRLLYAKFSSIVTYDHRDKERNRASNMCQLSRLLSFRGYDHHRYRRS